LDNGEIGNGRIRTITPFAKTENETLIPMIPNRNLVVVGAMILGGLRQARQQSRGRPARIGNPHYEPTESRSRYALQQFMQFDRIFLCVCMICSAHVSKYFLPRFAVDAEHAEPFIDHIIRQEQSFFMLLKNGSDRVSFASGDEQTSEDKSSSGKRLDSFPSLGRWVRYRGRV
jgi:hypothetical protein